MNHDAGRFALVRQIHSDWLGWLLAILVFAGYTAFSVWQWTNFVAPSWDLGIFTQLLERYSTASEPIVTIKGPDYNLWGDHFHPILVLLTPLYWLFPSGLTLMIAQNALFAISIVPITWLARSRMGRAGSLIALSYALSWGLANAVAVQFHEIAFAVPMLAFGLVAWLEGRLAAAAIWMGMLVFVKEDLGLTVALFGAIVLWAGRPGRRELRVGLGLVLWGLAWFALSVWVILPHFSQTGAWEYGDRITGEGGAWGVITSLLAPQEKLITLGLLVVACGIVGLASPVALLMLPTLAWRFVGNVEFYWGWGWHYSAILMPIAAIALIDGVGRRRSVRATRWMGPLAVTIALAGSLGMAYSGPLGLLARGQLPTLTVAERQAAEGMLDAVGAGRNVVTDLMALAYLVPGNTVFWEGTAFGAEVDAVALTPDSQLLPKGQAADQWAAEQFGGSWVLVYSRGGFQVAERQK